MRHVDVELKQLPVQAVASCSVSGNREEPDRGPLDRQRLQRAKILTDLAWRDLPREHRRLLENIGAAQRDVVDRPLGAYVDELLISSDQPRLPARRRRQLNHALGVWITGLRVVLIDAGHPALRDLDRPNYEMMLVHTAWHEWGHALSLARATQADVSAGERLLNLAPPGISEVIRTAGYRPRQYTHEVIAEAYALLMARRRRGETGKPAWLDDEIYEL